MKKTALSLAALLVGITLLQITAGAQSKEVGIVAHRGFWNCEEAGYAENSIAALRCAQEAGFRGSEFDVSMTSDEVLIVYHDSNINGKKIEKHPYSEFKDFRLKNGETIPTIDEYLQQGRKYPQTMLVYEMKRHSSSEVEDRFIELTIDKLKEHDLLYPEKVMFISFSYHICRRMAQLLPGFTVQYLRSEKSPSKVLKGGVNGINYNYRILNLTPRWVRNARRLGMSTNAWTVNNEESMKQMLRMGIDYLTTDNPVMARNLLSQEGYIELK